jgi:hypothetical protein
MALNFLSDRAQLADHGASGVRQTSVTPPFVRIDNRPGPWFAKAPSARVAPDAGTVSMPLLCVKPMTKTRPALKGGANG